MSFLLAVRVGVGLGAVIGYIVLCALFLFYSFTVLHSDRSVVRVGQ